MFWCRRRKCASNRTSGCRQGSTSCSKKNNISRITSIIVLLRLILISLINSNSSINNHNNTPIHCILSLLSNIRRYNIVHRWVNAFQLTIIPFLILIMILIREELSVHRSCSTHMRINQPRVITTCITITSRVPSPKLTTTSHNRSPLRVIAPSASNRPQLPLLAPQAVLLLNQLWSQTSWRSSPRVAE